MNNTFFSIIIPTLNSGKTLENCLKSILNQTYTDFEVLMMDGVSTDDTLQIASSFNDDRIRIYSEPDKGIYDAMNKGIDLAKGKWLYFLGSDDELFTEYVLEDVSRYIGFSSDMIFYGNVLINGDAGWAKDGDVYDGIFSKKKIIENNICHQAIFYHRNVFKTVGRYTLKYRINADHDFNIRACSKIKLNYIELIIAKFKGGGLSYNTDTQFQTDFYRIIIDNHLDILHKLNVSYKNILKRAFYHLIRFRPIIAYRLLIKIIRKRYETDRLLNTGNL